MSLHLAKPVAIVLAAAALANPGAALGRVVTESGPPGAGSPAVAVHDEHFPRVVSATASSGAVAVHDEHFPRVVSATVSSRAVAVHDEHFPSAGSSRQANPVAAASRAAGVAAPSTSVGSGSGFDWSDAAIGATIGAVLAAIAATVALGAARRRRQLA